MPRALAVPAAKEKIATPSLAGHKPSSAAPASDAPKGAFAQRYADLARRAESGDRDAAREIARSLGECESIPMQAFAAMSVKFLLDPALHPNRAHPMRPEAVAKLQQTSEKSDATVSALRDQCAGITRSQLDSRTQWLYRAAELGDAQSALEFGRGDSVHIGWSEALDQIPLWRDHAIGMLQSALDGGQADAARWLAEAYDPARDNFHVGPPSVPADAVEAYTYYSVLSMSGDDPGSRQFAGAALDRLDAELSDQERSEAILRAAEICEEDLGGQCQVPPAAPSP